MLEQSIEVENSPENIRQYNAYFNKTIMEFYNSQGVSQNLYNKHIKISCRLFVNPNATAKILIVNGYNESYIKYAEVIYDLFHKGYSVYVYDHRGQGFSDKFPGQKNRGFLNSFDDLVQDLTIYFKFIDKHDTKKTIFMLAHSMGGLVATLALFQNKINPKALALSAPMFGIQLTPFPILEYLIYLLSVLLSKIGLGGRYAFGQTDCLPLKPFKINKVTHSLPRYQVWQKVISETPDVQLGGPTFQWIRESVRASRKVRVMGKENTTPILLLQAQEDTVVRNDSQDIFLAHCAHAEKKVIFSAKHELLMEVNSLRDETLKYIEDFFKNNI